MYKNLEDKYLTFTDFVAENKKEEPEAEVVEESKTGDEGEEEKPKTKLYYVTDEVQQSQYINMFKEQGMDAVLLKHNIDSAFISHVEQKHEDVKFLRIDADVTESMREEISEEELKEEKDTLTEVFRKALGRENLEVKVEKLKNENISSMMTLSEENRRMQDMMKMYGMGGMDPSMFGGQETLVLNANNKLVQYIFENKDSEHVPMICGQLYDLAMLSHKQLAPEQMTKFIARSNEILALLTK